MSGRMTAGSVIRRHRLGHIPELRVGREIVEDRFTSGCSMANCNSDCCSGGVFADVAEKHQILLHADLIRSHMDPEQVKDPASWFEEETVGDTDYPSGRAVGTAVHDDRCVFLTGQGHCVLQKAAAASGMGRYALKPFFCWLYPVTLDGGVLTLDDPEFVDRPSCCKHGSEGDLTVFDVCPEELKLVLGEGGFAELRDGIVAPGE